MTHYIFETEAISPTKSHCHRCGHLLSNDVTFCTNCGKINTTFAPTINAHQRCPVHSQPMVNVCSLCSRPVCKSCYEDEAKTYGPYKCAQCSDRCEELEDSFFAQLEQTGKCARHSNRTRVGKCKSCGVPVCELCGYLWWEGRLFRKIVDGPYCTSCNATSSSSPGTDRDNNVKSILLEHALNKSFKIPAFVYDVSYVAPERPPKSGIQEIIVFDWFPNRSAALFAA